MSDRPQIVPSGSIAFVVASGVLLGTAGTAAALGPSEATAGALGALRLAVGAGVLLLLLPWLGGRWSRIPGLLRRPTIWIMAAGSAGYQPLFFGSVDRSGVALSTLLAVGSGPVFTGLLGWVFLRRRPTRAWVAATGLAVSGLFLVSWTDLRLQDALGPVLALGAGLCSAAYVVAAKAELDRGGQIVELPAVGYLIGAALLTPLLIGQPLGWVGTPAGLVTIAYLGIVTMAVANVLQVRGLRGLPPGPAATMLLADPMTATILGVAVLGESIPAIGLAGLVLVLAGLLLQGRALGRARTDTPGLEPAL